MLNLILPQEDEAVENVDQDATEVVDVEAHHSDNEKGKIEA